jgi:hypothetical protein
MMKNFSIFLQESSTTPWKTLVNKANWRLYSAPEEKAVSKAMTKEFSKLCTAAFKELATGNVTLDEAGKGVFKKFMSFKKQYYKLGADDTATDDVVVSLVSKIFKIPSERL